MFLTSKSVDAQLVFLQELGFRVYLVGSQRDREILHYVCLSATQMDIDWGRENKRIKSVEESRTISRAYSNLRLGSRRGIDTKAIPIDFMARLTGFVLYTILWTPQVALSEMIDTARTALGLLWLFLEDRGRIPVVDRHKVRLFGGTVFGFLGFLQRKHISNRQEQCKFAQTLAQNDIVALAGRILLLVLEDGSEFETPEQANQTFQNLVELEKPINKSAAAAPELFLDSKIEWAKVYVRLGAFIEMSPSSLSEERVRPLMDMFEVWQRYTGVRRDYNLEALP
ncbi:hypothetical protein FRC07_005496, partial [Ceratobasidium sp. 392]